MAAPALLLCVVLTCSVWAVQGRTLQIDITDLEQEDTDPGLEARGLPGTCWACKWALNKVKRVVGSKANAESLKSSLLAVCNEIGLLKPACRKFVKTHLWELIEELTTTDDVRTICVNTGACKPKEELHTDSHTDMNQPLAQYLINKLIK